MKLYPLFLGQCCVDKGAILTPGVDDGKRFHVPVPAYLIEIGDGKRVLVDTGMHPVHVDDPHSTFRDRPSVADVLQPVMRDEDRIERRLGELGFSVDDITHVVNTHLHFDHCGNNSVFGGRPILVQRRHYEAALELPGFPNERFDLPGLDYELVDGEQELFAGVRAIVTPGHAPFHQSLLVELPKTGKVLLCGDAIYTQDNLDHDTWSSQADPEAARESAYRLKRLAAAESAMMVFGHDVAQWRTLRHAPHFYD